MSADLTTTATSDRPPIAGHRWLPVLVLIAVIAVIAGGGELAGSAANGASAAPQNVGGAVRVRPLPGWAAAEPAGAPIPELVLSRGSVTLHVLAILDWSGSPEDLARTYLDRVLGPRFEDL